MPDTFTLDVSEAVDLGQPLTQTARIFVPDDPANAHAVLCCLPGGSYDWHYWHLDVPGHPGYSFAEHFASRGYVVVAVDHLGIGESSATDGLPLRLDHLARGDAAVAAEIRSRVSDGTLHADLPALDVPIVGVGHSMGACLTAIIQAQTRCYDAVVLLGYSAAVDNVFETDTASGTLEERIVASAAGVRALCGAGPDAEVAIVDRNLVRGLFYADDVPESVIAADAAVQACTPIYASAEAAAPGYAARFIEEIDVPVFLGFGDGTDLSPDPRAEPANYRRACDMTLYVLTGSSHCHNFSARRAALWDRIAAWLSTVMRDG
jgi:predicted alpha/beta hydrolase